MSTLHSRSNYKNSWCCKENTRQSMHVDLYHFLRPNISHIMFSSRHKGKSSLQPAETLLYDIMLIMLCEKQPSIFFGLNFVLSTLTSELLVLLKRRCASIAHQDMKTKYGLTLSTPRTFTGKKAPTFARLPYLLNTFKMRICSISLTSKAILTALQQHWTKKCQQTWNNRCYHAHIVLLSPLWRISCEDAFPARIFCYCRTQPALSLPYHLSHSNSFLWTNIV